MILSRWFAPRSEFVRMARENEWLWGQIERLTDRIAVHELPPDYWGSPTPPPLPSRPMIPEFVYVPKRRV